MKTYEIKEEQITEAHGAACSQWKQKIESWFPDVFKSKLEVGKWYMYGKREDCIVCYNGGNSGYGFWGGSWGESFIVATFNEYTPAADKEVEEMLIKEAVKRGYEGKSIKSLIEDGYITNETDNGRCTDSVSYNYIPSDNALELGYMTIFDNGKWAEIIKEEPSKEMTIEEIESKLGHKIKIVK